MLVSKPVASLPPRLNVLGVCLISISIHAVGIFFSLLSGMERRLSFQRSPGEKVELTEKGKFQAGVEYTFNLGRQRQNSVSLKSAWYRVGSSVKSQL